jgi:hypothetical protein
LESGDLSSHEDYKANRRNALGGRLLAYVQATGRGRIKITITSANLKSYKAELMAE